MKGLRSTRTISPAPHRNPDSPSARAAAFLSDGEHDRADGIFVLDKMSRIEDGAPVRPPFARSAAAARASADSIMARVRGMGAPELVSVTLPRARAARIVGLAAAAVFVAALSSIVTLGLIRSSAMVDVRFVLEAPEATSVWLAADFNEWSPAGFLMKKMPEGTWEITVPLRKGKAYAYNFIIDGSHWVADPLSPSRLDDGFGGSSSSLSL